MKKKCSEEKLLNAALSVERALSGFDPDTTNDIIDSLENLLEVLLDMNGYEKHTTYDWNGSPIVELQRKGQEDERS